ncbi:hypothetical protein VIH_001387 [Vibrio cholerae CT 5369-93]|nr:hypothetical protein VIH_001387 [Vibrio cholerae CT 5369-93]
MPSTTAISQALHFPSSRSTHPGLLCCSNQEFNGALRSQTKTQPLGN